MEAEDFAVGGGGSRKSAPSLVSGIVLIAAGIGVLTAQARSAPYGAALLLAGLLQVLVATWVKAIRQGRWVRSKRPERPWPDVDAFD